MTNDTSLNQPIQVTAPDPAESPSGDKGKRGFNAAEKLLLPVALVIGVLCDRLLFAPIVNDSKHITKFAGIFWMCYLVIYYLLHWKRIARERVPWYVAGCCTALCAWSFFFTGDNRNIEFSVLTYLVIPAVLMAHAQFTAGDYKLKDAGKIAVAWLTGWVIKPFSGLPAFLGVAGSLILGGNKPALRKALLGALVTLPLLCIIIPLLCGADQVFGYYIRKILSDFNLPSFIGHLLVVAIALMLFYSFLWNIGFASPKEAAVSKDRRVDAMISCIVTGTAVLVYALFCAVQFTYLFAGAGLPGDMTYSEYAREGFAQTIVICALNLLIFGVFLRYSAKSKAVSALLAALLALTAAMLGSGFVRLNLYIDAYGLTWLRLLSAWFIAYMAVVLVLCAVRMVKEHLPLAAVCAFILLGWYVTLGYLNPDALVVRYNVKAGGNAASWAEENSKYVDTLSDDGILALLENGFYAGGMRKTNDGYSLSSYRLRERAQDMR